MSKTYDREFKLEAAWMASEPGVTVNYVIRSCRICTISRMNRKSSKLNAKSD